MQSKTFSEGSSNILLLDSTITKKQLKILNNNFKKIITFDFESDRILISRKISHEISDNLIDNIWNLINIFNFVSFFCNSFE